MTREVAIRFAAADEEGAARSAPPRLDRFLASRFPAISRADFARLIADGGVLVDGRRAPKGLFLRDGQEIRFTLPEARARWTVAPTPALDLAIHYEDEHLVCVEKPPGIACHPLRPDERGTVANGLVARYPELNFVGKPLEAGLVHRLDTGTSGLLVAARAAQAHERLRAAWRAGEVTKIYLAVVRGVVLEAGEVDVPIQNRPGAGRTVIMARDAADPGGLPAHTRYEPVRVAGERTLVRVRLMEGRRHQIRLHLSLAGYPVVGDALYGRTEGGRETEAAGARGDEPGARLALHAHRIMLPHPATGRALALESPLPPDLAALLEG
jgi:23S rRNA pseudouridine1911/1915/1917 synthase